MPRQPTVTEIRLTNITACLTPALTLLNELNDAFGPLFIQPISNTVVSVMAMIQNVKRNKNECTDLLENIHKVLYAIVKLHMKSETAGSLPPLMVDHIGDFMEKPQCLLMLDNLETPWEPTHSRGGVEEFLSLLTDIHHVALIITMRALQPVSDQAAQQIFVDITDNFYEGDDIAQLLRLTDNMPLAVDLIAHLADYEGFLNVLARWETEKTTVLSMGYDQKSI
ncbi:hypothetical protein C8F04DRAFT_1270925 [Mycena alexandri]|uniref:Uncharacterized protein n=1 Tax=Mycena alexandri TaxID=1745969 RepID=A0AAD6WWM8_9AGAR|nr:hypothetical protein C8F04DRAFT_1270925 [Mycena alexandri]